MRPRFLEFAISWLCEETRLAVRSITCTERMIATRISLSHIANSKNLGLI
jgi:hypothetical protein